MTKKERIKTQIGCGYCKFERVCITHDGKTNFAKLGCKEFIHHEKPDKK